MENSIDAIQGLIWGVGSSFIYQAVLAIQTRDKNGYWPWHRPKDPMGGFAFAVVACVKLIIAGFVVLAFIKSNQLSGVFGCLAIGAAAEEIMIKIAASGRKVYK